MKNSLKQTIIYFIIYNTMMIKSGWRPLYEFLS